MAARRHGADAAAMADYGRNLGLAFQLVDDALDYGGATTAMGKHVGDDFREGKVTLPVILARAEGSDEDRAFWRRVMGGDQSDGDLAHAQTLLRRTHAIERTLEAARGYADTAAKALEGAPDSPARDALARLAVYVVDRVS